MGRRFGKIISVESRLWNYETEFRVWLQPFPKIWQQPAKSELGGDLLQTKNVSVFEKVLISHDWFRMIENSIDKGREITTFPRLTGFILYSSIWESSDFAWLKTALKTALRIALAKAAKLLRSRDS